MIKFIKNDFKRVRMYANYNRGKDIPLWIFTLYYVTVCTLLLPLLPLAMLFEHIAKKKMKKLSE